MSGSETPDRTVSGSEAPDRTGSRIVVTGGGEPDPAQLAALVVALTPSSGGTPDPGLPAWRRAALIEGVGGASMLAPSDLASSSLLRHP
jgi:hypothetical protein